MNANGNVDSQENVIFWSADEKAAYDPAGHGLAVVEESVVQLGRGPSCVNATVAAFGDVSLLRVRVGSRAVGTTVLSPDHLGVVIPVSWTGEYVLNGQEADKDTLYLTADTDCVHIRGDSRDTLGVILPRAPFVETVAALRGVDPINLTEADRLLAQVPAATNAVRCRIENVMARGVYPDVQAHGLAQEIFSLIIDAYLAARPEATSKGHGIRRPSIIVRKAEERFMAAEGRPVSLADLCAAAHVSKGTLYSAFHRVCGLPPLEYFSRRRLSRARVKLLDSPTQRGAVKRVALDCGFTELGRFAVKYRQLFGESPSVTLNTLPD